MEGTSEEVIVRPLVEDDLARVVAIERSSFSAPWSEEAFRSELRHAGTRSHLLVAELRGTVAGYIVYWVVGDDAEILDIAVAPSFRRLGLGAKVLGEAIADVERRGGRSLHLEIRASNTAALALYARHGFEKSYTRKGYYEKPREDAWVLRLVLGGQRSGGRGSVSPERPAGTGAGEHD